MAEDITDILTEAALTYQELQRLMDTVEFIGTEQQEAAAAAELLRLLNEYMSLYNRKYGDEPGRVTKAEAVANRDGFLALMAQVKPLLRPNQVN